MKFHLDSWRSDYAFPYEPPADAQPEVEGNAKPEDVRLDVEAPVHDWAPIFPDTSGLSPSLTGPQRFETVRFVDGVQCSDAVIWIDDTPTTAAMPNYADAERNPHSQSQPKRGPLPGLVASWGAGVIKSTPHGAELEKLSIDRGVFTDAKTISSIVAGGLEWRPQPAEAGWKAKGGSVQVGLGTDPDAVIDATGLRERLGSARQKLEASVGSFSGLGPDDLIVYDGLLHPSSPALAAVGLAKRAHRQYLPPSLQPLLSQLRGGHRTPIFAIDSKRDRFSFYLALSDPLPSAVAHPSSCVARLEFNAPFGTGTAAMTRFADRVAVTLPRFASEPHVDARAPQNLMPIRSLESELRRLLGKPSMIRSVLGGQAAVSGR